VFVVIMATCGLMIVRLVVVPYVVVGVPPPAQAPDKEAKAGQEQDATNYVTLLAFDLVLKLETDQCDHARQNQRGQHMTTRRQKADASYTTQTPSLGSPDNGDRSPMVGQC